MLSYFKLDWNRDLAIAVAMAVISLIISVVLLSGILVTLKPLAGDEPHYLVVTNSIITDGDLDLTDDYNSEQCWRDFYNGTLGPHYAPGLNGKYSTRPAGLSYYLVPWYFIGKITGTIPFWSRLGMAVLFALFLMQLYLLLRDLDISLRASPAATAVSALSIPLLFYSYSIFPEIPAALLCIVSVRLLLGWDQRTLLHPLLAGAALSLLPWLGVKYGVLSVVFGIGILIFIITSRAPLFRSCGYFLLVPVLSLALLLLYLWNIYGVLSPEAIYTGVGDGAKTTGGFNMQAYGEHTGNRIGSFFRVMLLYLFDQRDGLLFYSPFYLLGITGLLMLQGKKPFARTMLLAFAGFWCAYALSAWYSGYAPSARPLVSVLWILVLGLAWIFERLNTDSVRLIAIVTIAFSLAFAMIHMAENHLMYHVIDFATQEHGNNLLTSIAAPFDLASFFPNLVSPNDIHPLPTILCITVAVALGVVIWRGALAANKKPSQVFSIGALLAAGLPVLLVLVASQFAIFIAPEDMQGQGGTRLVFRDANTYGYEPVQYRQETYHGFWQQGGTTAQIYVVSGLRPESYTLLVHSRVPQDVTINTPSGSHTISFESPAWKEFSLPGESALNWTNRALLPLNIITQSGFRPSDEGKADTRYLGARIAIYTSP